MRLLLFFLFLFFLTSSIAQKCIASQSCWPSKEIINNFKSTLTAASSLFVPSDKGFDNAVKLENARIDKSSPGLVVLVNSTKDVISSLDFAKEFNLLISIKSTGHCYSGSCMVLDSFHIDLSRMNSLTIDTKSQTATAGPGVRFETLYKEAESAGFLAVGGMGSTVGLVGYTSGGGHSPIGRSFGLGADQVLSYEMVTASSEVITVSSDGDYSDLFFAIRGGGGGSWGIITQIKVKIHPIPKTYASISCHYPLINKLKPDIKGQIVLSNYINLVAPILPSGWTIYTSISLDPVIPLSLPSFDEITMRGLLSFEGFYLGNATYEEALTSVLPLTNFKPEWQIKCTSKKEISFTKWHSSMWFSGTPSILPKLREYMVSGFVKSSEVDSDALANVIAEQTLSLTFGSKNSWFIIHIGGEIIPSFQNQTSISDSFRNSNLIVESTANYMFKVQDESQIKWINDCGKGIHALDGVRGQYLNEADPQSDNYISDFWDDSVYKQLVEIKRKYDKNELFTCDQCVKLQNNKLKGFSSIN